MDGRLCVGEQGEHRECVRADVFAQRSFVQKATNVAVFRVPVFSLFPIRVIQGMVMGMRIGVAMNIEALRFDHLESASS